MTTTVRILSVDESETLDEVGESRPATQVQYTSARWGPRTLFITPVGATEEQVAQAIRDDLAELEAEPPPPIEV